MIGEKGRKIKGLQAHRDLNTGAVVNNNKNQYMKRKREIEQYHAINKVDTLENEVAELKNMLRELLDAKI